MTGSRWKLAEASGRKYKKLKVSGEPMEVFTTSKEAPTTSMERSINLHGIERFNDENNFKVRETCSNCMKTRRRRSVTNCEIERRAKHQESSFSAAGGRVVGAGGWRELLVSKGIGKREVEVIAVEILVFIRRFTFLV